MPLDKSRFRIWLSNWSIVARVLAAPVIMLVTLALLSFVGWQTLKTQRTMVAASYEELQPILTHANNVPQELSRIEAHLYKLSAWGQIGVQGSELETTIRTINQSLDTVKRDIDALEAARLDGVDDLRSAYLDYRKNTNWRID